jgi:probable phosphoglycerate mutase
MRLILVRHGEPNYKTDCLTEKGRLQAEAVSRRLQDEEIAAIYSSNLGRAKETAAYIAAPRGLTVTELPYMRELGWSESKVELPFGGHPWLLADAIVAEGGDVHATDYAENGYFKDNNATRRAALVAEGIDGLLADYGYRREGQYYRVEREDTRTILIASHGGSSNALIAHLLGLPLPFVMGTMCPAFTSVTVLHLKGEAGQRIIPHLEVFNDHRHILGLTGEMKLGM